MAASIHSPSRRYLGHKFWSDLNKRAAVDPQPPAHPFENYLRLARVLPASEVEAGLAHALAATCRAQEFDAARQAAVINMMETSKHRYCNDLSSLNASLRRRCRRWAVVQSNDGAPVVEIADILGQNLRQMALIEDEYVVQALGPDRSHPALGDGVGPRRSERRASLVNTETTHPQ